MSLPTATVEGRLQRQLLHRTAPTPHDSISTRSGATRFLTPLRDPQTWLDLLWILVHFIISMVTLSIALTWAVGETQRELGTLRTSRDAGRQAETDQLRRLERDIHDGPQQRLVRLNMDLARARRMAATDPVRMLTQREREVLELMAQGHSNARIAADLVVTEGAVEKHTQRIFAKLGLQADAEVHRRVSAVLMLLQAPG